MLSNKVTIALAMPLSNKPTINTVLTLDTFRLMYKINNAKIKLPKKAKSITYEIYFVTLVLLNFADF